MLLLAAGVSGCDREKSRWRSAQSADSVDAYERFVQLHPQSELVKQAQTRIKQLNEERDWQRVSKSNTLDAYRGFLTRHPGGKWAHEARIRLDAMLLENQAESPPSETFEVRRIGPNGVVSAPIKPSAAPTAPAAPPQIVAAEPASIPASAGNVSADVTAVPTASDEDQSKSDESKTMENVVGATAPEPSAGTSEPGPETPEPGAATNAQENAAGSETPEAPPQSASINDSFGIQLGAFTSESKAYDEWQRLRTVYRSELGSLQPHISTALTTTGEVFRLQADVGNEQSARTICASLLEKSQGCVVVLPHR